MSEQPKRKVTPEDLYRFIQVSDPQITPDGETIAFVRAHVDAETKEFRSAIWAVTPTSGGAPVQFTRGAKEKMPRWSPDGRTLAFISDRGGDDQIWLIDRYGGEARQLTTMHYGAHSPVWSPDGKRIAFLSSVAPDSKRDILPCTKTEADKKAEEQKAKDEARCYSQMDWRQDATGFRTGRYNQIWVVDLPQGGAPTPTPIQVTWGSYDHGNPQWSPDGRLLSFSSKRSDDENGLFYDVHLTAVPVPGDTTAAKEAECNFACTTLTPSEGYFWVGVFSPDGQTVAVVGYEREYENASQAKIYLYPIQGGAPRVLDNWDLAITDTVGADVRMGATGIPLTWAPDGNMIYASVSERGACSVYGWPVAGGRPALIAGGKREIYCGSFDRNCETLAFAAADLEHIGDIYVMDCRECTEKRLTDFNDALFAEMQMPEIEEMTVTAPDGWEVHGWLMKPVDFEPGTTYPLVLNIHGGPHTCFGYTYFHEIQLLAAHGYGVLFVNPRGSTSYGQTFVNGVRGHYGDGDYKDLMAAVDYAVTQDWVDGERLAVTGGSYGGWMTNWIVGHTDRFRAAVSCRCISNWVSFSGTPDFGPIFNHMQHLVEDPWSPEGVQALWDLSPIKYVKNIKTPIAFFHSEQDYRCPIEQAEQIFMAIKFYKQAPTELVRHPRSNHDLTRIGPPAVRVDRFHRLLKWFKTYCPVNEEKKVLAEV